MSNHPFFDRNPFKPQSGQTEEPEQSAMPLAGDPVGMILQLADGSVQACNAAAEEILGFTLAQIQGCQYIDCPWQTIHADGSPFPGDTHPPMQVLQTGQAVTNEVMGIYQPSGNLVWLQINSQPLFQQDSTTPWAVVTTFVPLDESDRTTFVPLDKSDRETHCETIFRRLVEISMFGVAIGDFSGRMLYANDALLNMIGYSRAELEAGQIRWIDLTPPEYLHLDWQAGEELRQRGVSTPFEKEYIHKDGHRVPILIGGALLNEPDSEQELIIGFYLDLSHLKQTENSLQNALQTLNSHVENTPMAVVEWDANFIVRRWSGAAPQIFGWSAEEVLGTYISDLNLVYEADIPIVAEVSQRILSGTEPQLVCRNRNYTKDGSILHCIWYNSTLTDSMGQVTSILSLVLDITEQVKAEAALRQSEERFRLAARAVAGMVYDWNVQTGEVYRSEGVYQLIGFHPAAVPQNSAWWAEQMHPDDYKQIEQQWAMLVDGQRDRYEFEYRICHREGHWVHVWDRGYPIRDRQGKIIRVVGSTTDITARKQMEQQREQLLQQEQIAREQAEAAIRVKDEFIAAVSHELRTPLNPILGWSKLLQSHSLSPEKQTQALATIERNAKLQAQLIEDLLDISRIMQGKLTLNVAPVQLETIVAAALETVQFAAEAKAVALHVSLAPGLPSIMGDATRLQQVVWNLLSNAIKFTPSGGQIHVSVSCSQDCASESYAQIVVQDTGVGIAPDFLPHVFEYFRQENGATTRQFGGLGLGLAIVKQIVELHGGTIQAGSAGIGQGATFTVKLPLSNQVVES